MMNDEILNDRPETENPAKAKSSRSRLSRLSSKLNRRNLIIFASIVLLGGAVYINWLFFSDDTVKTDNDKVLDYSQGESGDIFISTDNADIESETESYFAMTQLNRQRARDEAMEALQLVVDSPNSLAELKEGAMQSMARIAEDIAAEANIESLVCAKGFEKCVAVLNENSASVVVKSTGLLPNEVIQIKEIVVEQSGLNPSAVRIIEIE
ncbi:MAG: SpoIIIAH-like family protein [Eubacteriales bacterium]|jgi:stage III sporulation protein AH|nr:SpoIIIAH-like family protein [Eubacteriales bacterium]